MRNPFKKKPYHNPSRYVTVRELREWLDRDSIPDDHNIKIGGELMTEMYYHEISGVHFE